MTPFNDLPEGRTHFQNDGCGELAHNDERKYWCKHCKKFVKGVFAGGTDRSGDVHYEVSCGDCGELINED